MSKTKTSKMDGPRVDDTESDAPVKGADNMHIWDQVCKTDRKDTKEVTFGRKFTAIDAYSQIRRATEIFGPLGIGWGYDVVVTIESETAISKLSLWYRAPLTGVLSEHIHVYGGATPDRDKQGVIKAKGWQDTFKKATTDALTKALSMLGFNADVFLGAFDSCPHDVDRKPQQKPQQSPPQDRMVPREDPPPSTGVEMSEPQRKAVYAIATKLWGSGGYKTGIKEVCDKLGFDPKALTKKQASAVINKLKQLNGEEIGDGKRNDSDDVPF